MTFAPGSTLPQSGDVLDDRYRLIERLGAGAMGRVYRARDETLRRDVAVKIYDADPRDDVDPARRSAEARVLASLDHPSLVTLYDARVTGGLPVYLVMELIEGPTLQRRIDDGAMPAAEVAKVLSDLAQALAAVHRAGIVHRDVKPSNVLLRSPQAGTGPVEAVLADFGVAHLLDTPRLTSPGTIIGTAAYLAPEQVRGEPPQAASDVYALGLLTIEMLTRLHPFPGGTLEETVLARLTRQPDVPGELGYAWKSLLSAMTSPEPSCRPSADEVAARAVELAQSHAPRLSPRREARARLLAEALATAPSAVVHADASPSEASRPEPQPAASASAPGVPRGWLAATALAAVTGTRAAMVALGVRPRADPRA